MAIDDEERRVFLPGLTITYIVCRLARPQDLAPSSCMPQKLEV